MELACYFLKIIMLALRSVICIHFLRLKLALISYLFPTSLLPAFICQTFLAFISVLTGFHDWGSETRRAQLLITSLTSTYPAHRKTKVRWGQLISYLHLAFGSVNHFKGWKAHRIFNQEFNFNHNLGVSQSVQTFKQDNLLKVVFFYW